MPLEQHPLLGVRYVQSVRELGAPDLVILPGTKNTVNDLLWLRQSGLEAAVLKLAAGADGLYRRKAPRTGHGDGCRALCRGCADRI